MFQTTAKGEQEPVVDARALIEDNGENGTLALRARGHLVAAALVCQRQARLITPETTAHTTALASSLLEPATTP